jgi:hypothetical protein
VTSHEILEAAFAAIPNSYMTFGEKPKRWSRSDTIHRKHKTTRSVEKVAKKPVRSVAYHATVTPTRSTGSCPPSFGFL